MLIEVHMLKNYAPTNLNRDDSGAPKTCMFGGVKRGRISSQCLKHSWRTSKFLHDEIGDDALGIRTRKLPDIIAERLESEGVESDIVDYVKGELTGIGTKEGKGTKDNKTAQIIMYSKADIDAIAGYVLDKVKGAKLADVKKNMKAKTLQDELKKDSKRSLSLDMALFGRMVTSDAFADVEASMQVAHAISTNRIMMESDFFTAVDDLIDGDEESGSAMMGDIDYNSSCYYIYASIDVDKLCENLSVEDNAEDIAREVIPKLIETMAYTNPTGKQNSFAGHSLPSAVLVEVKDKHIPVSYANAFEVPARADSEGGLIDNSISKLVKECNAIQNAYGLPVVKRLWFNPEGDKGIKVDNAVECSTFASLIDNLM